MDVSRARSQNCLHCGAARSDQLLLVGIVPSLQRTPITLWFKYLQKRRMSDVSLTGSLKDKQRHLPPVILNAGSYGLVGVPSWEELRDVIASGSFHDFEHVFVVQGILVDLNFHTHDSAGA